AHPPPRAAHGPGGRLRLQWTDPRSRHLGPGRRGLRLADTLLPHPGPGPLRGALEGRPPARAGPRLARPAFHHRCPARAGAVTVPSGVRARSCNPLPPGPRSSLMPDLATLLFLAGFAQLCVLVASALVPFQLDWKQVFQALPPLHRQMYWVYG